MCKGPEPEGYIHTHTCIYIHRYTHTGTHICIYTHIYIHMGTYIHIQIHSTHMLTYKYTHIHRYIRTCIYTQGTYIQTWHFACCCEVYQ